MFTVETFHEATSLCVVHKLGLAEKVYFLLLMGSVGDFVTFNLKSL